MLWAALVGAPVGVAAGAGCLLASSSRTQQSTRRRRWASLRLCRCGTAGSNPRGLSPGERLQAPLDWLASPACRQQVKEYFSLVAGRRNSVTGVLYRDDPTIMSWVGGGSGQGRGRGRLVLGWCWWLAATALPQRAAPRALHLSAVQNVLNEPRCVNCDPSAIDSWIGEMSAHLKARRTPVCTGRGPCLLHWLLAAAWGPAALRRAACPLKAFQPAQQPLQSVAPNQLVTTGAEGFLASGDALAGAPPQQSLLPVRQTRCGDQHCPPDAPCHACMLCRAAAPRPQAPTPPAAGPATAGRTSGATTRTRPLTMQSSTCGPTMCATGSNNELAALWCSLLLAGWLAEGACPAVHAPGLTPAAPCCAAQWGVPNNLAFGQQWISAHAQASCCAGAPCRHQRCRVKGPGAPMPHRSQASSMACCARCAGGPRARHSASA